MTPVLDRFQSLHAVDYAAIAAYFAVVIGVGFYYGRRQKSTEDYFLAGRSLSWFSVGVSIVATVLSTVTYLSTPGEMIKNGVGANAQFLSYPLVFFLVSYLILPYLMRLRFTTAYEYLERRFDLTTRLFGASLFVLIRTAWMGMVLFTASLALSKICSLSFTTVVLGLVAIGVFYTVLGGLRAVIWTDVVQFFILLGGAIFTVVYVAVDSGTGPATWWNDMMAADTPSQPVFSFDPTVRLSLVGMGCWTLFWWLATASSDQVAVQRFLATESLQASRRAFLCNLVSGVVLTLTLSLCGIALYSYYQAAIPDDPDLVFPHFIRHILPRGLAGLVVAALFSAAMSSLDSGMNSISSVVVTDFYRRFRSAVPTRRAKSSSWPVPSPPRWADWPPPSVFSSIRSRKNRGGICSTSRDGSPVFWWEAWEDSCSSPCWGFAAAPGWPWEARSAGSWWGFSGLRATGCSAFPSWPGCG